MNKEQRKFAVNAIKEATSRKAVAITQERDKDMETLAATSHPAKLYMAELAKNEKERKVLADKIVTALQTRELDIKCSWNPDVAIDVMDDTRLHPSTEVETPMLKRLKKAYYDEVDRLCKVRQDRLDKLNARSRALITQIWLSDLPQELADMLKAFESEEF